MQGPPPPPPIEVDEASVPTEHVPSSPQPPALSSAGNRKAAKRTFPFDLKADEIQLALSRPPRRSLRARVEIDRLGDFTDSALNDPERRSDVDVPARKRPRLEEVFPTSADEATTENTSHDTPVAPRPLEAAAAATDHADSDPVVDMHPSARTTTWTLRRWTPEEDAKLTSAVTNTPKFKYGKEYNMDWIAISALVPGRTKSMCLKRWNYASNPNIDPTTARTGTWEEDEDNKLRDAVRVHSGKDWVAISAHVPGRTKEQCRRRWMVVLCYY
jgi:hypothetical protein